MGLKWLRCFFGVGTHAGFQGATKRRDHIFWEGTLEQTHTHTHTSMSSFQKDLSFWQGWVKFWGSLGWGFIRGAPSDVKARKWVTQLSKRRLRVSQEELFRTQREPRDAAHLLEPAVTLWQKSGGQVVGGCEHEDPRVGRFQDNVHKERIGSSPMASPI